MSQVLCGDCCRSDSPSSCFSFPSLIAAPSSGLYSRDITAEAARRNVINGFHQRWFFPRREPSVFPVGSGHGPHDAVVG
jgi:hypothetical protein